MTEQMREPVDSEAPQSCSKCGLETTEGLYTPTGIVPFCEWCFQEFLGVVRGDRG